MNSNQNIQFSIIIAVYQRKDELIELLESLVKQNCNDFEVIIVDDGSPESLAPIAQDFQENLNLKYFYKENSGPGLSRNVGMKNASGNYFIFLDSDTIIPENYICEVRKELEIHFVDFFGGSDSSKDSFSDLQKAINFSMTSFLTTGGIRGGKQKISKFQPRSFNMGISRKAFEATGGFGNMRIGEDPDLTMTLWEKGFKSHWFPKAYVYHKRRTSRAKFAHQVKGFGRARPILNQKHPAYSAITFWFPSVFMLGLVISVTISFLGYWWFLACYGIYFILIFLISTIQNKSLKVGLLSVITTFIQFRNYGFGFMESQIKLNLMGMKPEKAFPHHFTKIN